MIDREALELERQRNHLEKLNKQASEEGLQLSLVTEKSQKIQAAIRKQEREGVNMQSEVHRLITRSNSKWTKWTNFKIAEKQEYIWLNSVK